jgi:hypothetical protein
MICICIFTYNKLHLIRKITILLCQESDGSLKSYKNFPTSYATRNFFPIPETNMILLTSAGDTPIMEITITKEEAFRVVPYAKMNSLKNVQAKFLRS